MKLLPKTSPASASVKLAMTTQYENRRAGGHPQGRPGPGSRCHYPRPNDAKNNIPEIKVTMAAQFRADANELALDVNEYMFNYMLDMAYNPRSLDPSNAQDAADLAAVKGQLTNLVGRISALIDQYPHVRAQLLTLPAERVRYERKATPVASPAPAPTAIPAPAHSPSQAPVARSGLMPVSSIVPPSIPAATRAPTASIPPPGSPRHQMAPGVTTLTPVSIPSSVPVATIPRPSSPPRSMVPGPQPTASIPRPTSSPRIPQPSVSSSSIPPPAASIPQPSSPSRSAPRVQTPPRMAVPEPTVNVPLPSSIPANAIHVTPANVDVILTPVN